jgi:hypothetical protein
MAARPRRTEERRETRLLPPVHAAIPPHYAASWSFWLAERQLQATGEGRPAVVDWMVLVALHLGLACRVFCRLEWQRLVLQ